MRHPFSIGALLAAACLLALCLLAPAAAQADDEADRLRDALRHTTIDLRAAEDSVAGLQASLDAANKQKAQLQQLLDAANARPAPAPAAPAPPPADLARLRAAASQAEAQNAGLRAALAKWQGAYQQAATIARQKDVESRTLGGQTKAHDAQLKTCEDENAKLSAVANDILHLYRSQSFHQVLVGSYEPLLGLDEVKLENIVQDYEDRIRNQEYVAGQTSNAPVSH